MVGKKRINGLDFARAWAMFGMLIINFSVITNAEGNGPPWLIHFTSLFQGRAAALFVVLAGIGISLMSRGTAADGDLTQIKSSRIIIWKRSLFLFVLGLSLYVLEWTGDILHYYGVYLLLASALLTVKNKWMIGLAIIILIAAQSLQVLFNVFQGWSDTAPFINYVDFWTAEGFIRNLLFNGYHPIFPWICFFLIGMVIGRLNLHDRTIRNRLLGLGLIMTISIEVISRVLIKWFNPIIGAEASAFLFNTGPILPNVLYMLSATGSAIIVLILCLYIAEKYEKGWFVTMIVRTGELTLTHYVSHVLVGIGILILLNRLENQSLAFVLLFSSCFFIFSVLFSLLWRKKFSRGPIELVMRRITG